MHRVPPAGMIRPPYYRKVYKHKHDKKQPAPGSWLREEYVNLGDKDESGPRLFDYYKTAELVKQIPKITERIEFVSPYEREWQAFDKKWHRAWLPAMMESRKAWCLQPTPKYFDSLNFYKYITKTRIVDGEKSAKVFDKFYENSLPSSPLFTKYTALSIFEDRAIEALICHLDSNEDESSLTEFLRHLVEDAGLSYCLAHSNPKLAFSRRVSYTSRCESFWIRSGFAKMTKRQEVWSGEVTPSKSRFTCDDRRRLGELAFTMRDKLALQIRSREPLQNVFEFAETDKLEAPIFEENVDIENEIIFNPKVYNLWPDSGILFQAPGYDADVDEPYKHGVLAVKGIAEINDLVKYWNPESVQEKVQIRRDFFASTALSTLFNWLNGQAHLKGYTQYTDIEAPITSQIILSTGEEFFFAIGQLNTIAINIDVQGFVNKNTNVCFVDGPHRLFDEFDKNTGAFKHKSSDGAMVNGLNPYVLRRILQMVHV